MGNLALAIANAIKDYSEGVICSFDELYNQLDREINNVTVKVFREDAGIPLPEYSKHGDACCDVYAKSIEYDADKDRFIVHTGLHFALPDNYEMELRPRSSSTKTEVYIPNNPGTIDWGYRGEMLVIFKNRTARNVIKAISNIGTALGKMTKAYDPAESYIMEARKNYNMLSLLEGCPYKEGDRIAQLLVRRRELIEWDEVEYLDELGTTERGTGGFGHTGK